MSATFALEALGTMDSVVLCPKWDYKFSTQMDRSDHRSYAQNLFSYRWMAYDKIEMTLEWLAAADAGLIRSWFENRNRVIFTIDRGDDYKMQLFRLDSLVSPLRLMLNPNYYQGKLALKSINRSQVFLYHLVDEGGDYIMTQDSYYIGCIV